MRRPAILSLAMLILASSGCATIDRVNDALYETGMFDLAPSQVRAVARECDVTLIAGPRRGRGVVVGTSRVLTVAHVVGGETAR